MIHELKTWPIYYQAIANLTKRFEVRKNDRNYKVGDTLLLKEWKPEPAIFKGKLQGQYTGNEIMMSITYILDNYPALNNGYVVMSITPVNTILNPST